MFNMACRNDTIGDVLNEILTRGYVRKKRDQTSTHKILKMGHIICTIIETRTISLVMSWRFLSLFMGDMDVTSGLL